MKLSIIVVVHNAFPFVDKCLGSLYKDNLKSTEIIIIDNASQEYGLARIKHKYPFVKYIRNKKNLGFAKAVNMGAKKSKGKYILILNPDTIMLDGTIIYNLNYMDKHKDVALVGCRVFSKDKILQMSAGYAYPGLMNHIYEYNYVLYKILKKIIPSYNPILYPIKDHFKNLFVKHLIGVYLMIRKDTFIKLLGFDENYFLYREETDFCKRLIDKKWKIAYLPEKGGVVHLGAGSSGLKNTQSSNYYLKSTYYFIKKKYSKSYCYFVWFIGLLSSIMSVLYVLIERLYNKNKPEKNNNLNNWINILRWHLSLEIFKI